MGDHIHTMEEAPEPHKKVGKYFKCNSCQFKCTPAVLDRVNANKSQHRAIGKKHRQAKVIWGA